MIPCYNEAENVGPISERIVEIMTTELAEYDYELLFIDNFSIDGTREKLTEICAQNKKIKAIFNVTNFGQFNSPFYGMCQTSGDCTISMACDFQDPPELIPQFVLDNPALADVTIDPVGVDLTRQTITCTLGFKF